MCTGIELKLVSLSNGVIPYLEQEVVGYNSNKCKCSCNQEGEQEHIPIQKRCGAHLVPCLLQPDSYSIPRQPCVYPTGPRPYHVPQHNQRVWEPWRILKVIWRIQKVLYQGSHLETICTLRSTQQCYIPGFRLQGCKSHHRLSLMAPHELGTPLLDLHKARKLLNQQHAPMA